MQLASLLKTSLAYFMMSNFKSLHLRGSGEACFQDKILLLELLENISWMKMVQIADN